MILCNNSFYMWYFSLAIYLCFPHFSFAEQAPDNILKPEQLSVKGIINQSAEISWSLFHLPNRRLKQSFLGLTLRVWDKEHQTLSGLITISKENIITKHALLKEKTSRYYGRVNWTGDLSKNLASLTVFPVTYLDEAEFDCILNFAESQKVLRYNALYSTAKLAVCGNRISTFLN